jgi:hypothetical protein
MSSEAVKEVISASQPGSAAALLHLLVEDVKLRDKGHFASLAVRALHSLNLHCGIKTVCISYLCRFQILSMEMKYVLCSGLKCCSFLQTIRVSH